MSKVQPATVSCDVLVVGGGLAGIMAAIRAKDFASDVILVDKAIVARSGATVFVHGALGPAPEGDEDIWVEELAEHAGYVCDQEWARILVEDQRARIKDMEKWGGPFERNSDGSLKVERGRGQKRTSIVMYEGKSMMEVMKRHALDQGVQIHERVAITDLLTTDGLYPTKERIAGALGFNPLSGSLVLYQAKAVILTTGLGSLKQRCLNVDNMTGDGQIMAYKVGAEMMGLEFAMAPTFSIWNRMLNTHSQSQYQCHGAKIVNSLGERIIEKYFPGRTEQSLDFGTLSRMVAKETLERRGPVYFDLLGWTDEQVEKMRRIQPRSMKGFDSAGINVQSMIESTPIMTAYSSSGEGGVRIGKHAETTIPGLYAAGVCALITANISSLMGVPQSFCAVAGYRAGEHAAKNALSLPQAELKTEQVFAGLNRLFGPLARTNGYTPDQVLDQIAQTIAPLDVSFFKTRDSIENTLRNLAAIRLDMIGAGCAKDGHGLLKLLEAENILTLTELVYLSALERKESRLTHFRTDYPYRDDANWLQWIVVKNENGNPLVRIEPIDIDGYQFQPPIREKVELPV